VQVADIDNTQVHSFLSPRICLAAIRASANTTPPFNAGITIWRTTTIPSAQKLIGVALLRGCHQRR
jgi:hypothetical protein